jgi:hypothetical protein
MILPQRPESWQEFFELTKSIETPEDFVANRKDKPPQERVQCTI